MFSSISHEFRTPINAFSNSIHLLESNLADLRHDFKNELQTSSSFKASFDSKMEQNKKFIKIGKISSKLLLNLTEDILDLAKIEAGKFSLNEEQF
jgi:signal transduction histidine kinase